MARGYSEFSTNESENNFNYGSSRNSSNNNNDAGNFECNICLELAQDPIVTLCGHLYCWPCLYEWLHVHSHASECPVCKAVIEEDKLVPLYGRGKTSTDPRSKSRPKNQIKEIAMEESPKLEEEVEEESNNGISEYEKQRLARIRENETRLQALGLPRLASSLLPSKKPKKSERKPNKNRKKKRHNDDDEYRPSDEESDGGANLEESEEEEEEEVVGSSSISQRKGKRKTPSKATKMKNCSYTKIKAEEFNEIDDHTALQQAIALSLGEITEGSAALSDLSTGKSVKIDKPNIQETVGRRNNKKTKSRVQLTEDEVVAYFFTFDESGKGYVSLRDVERMAVAHDFNWTEMEVASMIHSFDSDRDGKLSLEDFRTIVSRCNMMQEIGQIRQHDARDWTELSRV